MTRHNMKNDLVERRMHTKILLLSSIMCGVDTAWISLTTAHSNGMEYDSSKTTWSQGKYHTFERWHNWLTFNRVSRLCSAIRRSAHRVVITIQFIAHAHFSASPAAHALFRFTQPHAIYFPVCYAACLCYGHRFANGDVYMLWRSATNWLMKSIYGIDMFHACKLALLPVPPVPIGLLSKAFLFQFLKCFAGIAVKITYFSNLYISFALLNLKMIVFFSFVGVYYFPLFEVHSMHLIFRSVWIQRHTSKRSFQTAIHQL